MIDAPGATISSSFGCRLAADRDVFHHILWWAITGDSIPLPDPGACRSWRLFALGRPVVDFGLPRTTIWCQQPFHHDHGGSDEVPVPDLL
jgi:hypothetical protein